MTQKFDIISDISDEFSSWEFRREAVLIAGFSTNISGGNYLHSISSPSSVSRPYKFPTIYTSQDFTWDRPVILEHNWAYEKPWILVHPSPGHHSTINQADIGFERLQASGKSSQEKSSVLVLSESTLPRDAPNERLYGLFAFADHSSRLHGNHASEIAFEFYYYLRRLFKVHGDIRLRDPLQLTLPNLDFVHNRIFQL